MGTNGINDGEERQAIIDQLTRYCFAVDFGDWSALDSIFADDVHATYYLGPHGMEDVDRDSRVAIVDWLRSVMGESSSQVPMHAMTNHLVTIDGDSARSQSYLAGGPGLYTVEWRRTPDGWRAHRWEMRNYVVPDSYRSSPQQAAR